MSDDNIQKHDGSFPVHLAANKPARLFNRQRNFGVFTLMGRYVHTIPEYNYLVVLDDIQNVGHLIAIDVAHKSSYMVMVTNLSDHSRLVTVSQGKLHHELGPQRYQAIHQEPFNLFLYGKTINGADVVVNISVVPHSEECSMEISYTMEPFVPAEEIKKEPKTKLSRLAKTLLDLLPNQH